MRTKLSNLKDSRVRQVKLTHVMKHSAQSLQKRAVETNIQVEQTRRNLKRGSSTSERAEGDQNDKMDSIKVENLVYSGLNPIFESE